MRRQVVRSAIRPRKPPPAAELAGARQVSVERIARGAASDGAAVELDWVAVEEPLEIRVEERPFAITLRTPGHDRELTLGFLLAEGIVESSRDVASLRLEPGERGGAARGSRAWVTLEPAALDRWARRQVERELRVTSACGACGKPSLEDLWRVEGLPVAPIVFDAMLAPALLREMRARQLLFERTGGLHAAAAFDPDGRCLGVFEDVGRHNALDKLVGSRAERPLLGSGAGRGRPLEGTILVVSGRVGLEIVQKAAMAGTPVIVAVGAASSLAVELAATAGIELMTFAGSAGAHRHVRGE